jgi:heme oxygenase
MPGRLPESAKYECVCHRERDAKNTLMQASVVTKSVSSLSAAMRAGSRREHEAAEQSPFLGELLSGDLAKCAYIDYLLRLRVVYAALESAVRSDRDDPLVAAVYDPILERLPAIDADLSHWGCGVLPDINSSAAEAYRSRLESVRGGSLLAHHYTRYLGDLSGGRVIRRALNRVYNLGGVGLAFYDFPIHAKRYKDSYRARLDDLRLHTEEVEQVVNEVKLAFRLNQALFDELTANLATYRAQEAPTE